MRKKSCGRSFIMSICKVQVCQRRCCKSAQFSQLVQRQLFTSLPSLWHPSALNRIGLVARRGPSQKWKLMSLNIWQSDNKETIRNCKHGQKKTQTTITWCVLLVLVYEDVEEMSLQSQPASAKCFSLRSCGGSWRIDSSHRFLDRVWRTVNHLTRALSLYQSGPSHLQFFPRGRPATT